MNGMTSQMLNTNLNNMYMRYLRIILIAVVLLITSACIDNLENLTPNIGSSDEITVIGRITRFDDYNLQTRAVKQSEESIITSYALAIFHVENGNATECVYYENNPSASQLLFNIDRKNITHTPGDRYAIYVFANMPGMGQFGIGDTLGEMLEATCDVEDLGIPGEGFPMIGSLGDNFSSNIDRDNQVFIMTPKYEAGKEMPAPQVDGKDMTTLNVPMKALFAKMNFEIEVRPDQIIEGSTYTPQFLLKSYRIVNAPNSIDFSKSTNPVSNQTDVLDAQEVNELNETASGARKIEFSFYIPENLQEPDKTPDTFDYPFATQVKDESGNVIENIIRDEDTEYRQRYKGLLLKQNQPATHIVLVGEFRDHQNHTVDVEYTIHLGKDNYSDFNIVRNGEYNNYITIRGILNSDANKENYISLDHRVNVTHREPTIISLRREVLLDSHFEVRPLRIKFNDDFTHSSETKPTHIKVEVLNASGQSNPTNWIRLEQSFGNGKTNDDPVVNGKSIYITQDDVNEEANISKRDISSSKGKRRYFTTGLVSGGSDYSLVNSTSVIVDFPDEKGEEECIWIYVDECLDEGDAVRTGMVKVTYGNRAADGTFNATSNPSYKPIEYAISQRKLFRVSNNGKNYNIEYHEEYLHNFDSDETYGHTHYEGMEWGAENVQFSHQFPAVYVTLNEGVLDFINGILGFIGLDFIDDWSNAVINSLMEDINPRYDFYLTRDKVKLALKEDSNYNDDVKDGIIIRDYSGHTFSQELIAALFIEEEKDVNNEKEFISSGTLASKPLSAVEYCYNKNKRDINGNVTNPKWYLPAIDEIEEIVTSKYVSEGTSYNTYARFLDFQAKFYWSSQPAYIQNDVEVETFMRIFGRKSSMGISTGKIFVDNVGDVNAGDPGSARATSVSYVNEIYEPVPSGLNGSAYKYYYDYYDNNDGNDKNDITFEKQELNTSLPEIDGGYKSRTDMARVRCVRKMN